MTQRQYEIIEAALSYAASNIDDLNDVMRSDEQPDCISVQNRNIPELTEEEVEIIRQIVAIELRQ